MAEHSSFLTWARFRSMYPETEAVIMCGEDGGHVEQMDLGIAEEHFKRFAVPGAQTIDADLVKKDLEALTERAKVCSDYADQRVAHYDKNPTAATPKFQDLDDAIGLLGELVQKYFLLFRGIGMSSLEPEFQGDWRAIFLEPWIRLPGSELE